MRFSRRQPIETERRRHYRVHDPAAADIEARCEMRIAVERGCGRLEWAVLNWNSPAIEFYKSFGAKPQGEWTVFRLSGDALRAFGGHGASPR